MSTGLSRLGSLGVDETLTRSPPARLINAAPVDVASAKDRGAARSAKEGSHERHPASKRVVVVRGGSGFILPQALMPEVPALSDVFQAKIVVARPRKRTHNT